MALGDLLVEFGLRLVFEFVVYGITYWLGFVILKVVSLGQLPIAPFWTIHDRNRARKFDWSIWLHSPFQAKALKADVACLAGLIAVLLGVGLYLIFK